MEDTVYRVIEIENEIYNGWTPEEREHVYETEQRILQRN